MKKRKTTLFCAVIACLLTAGCAGGQTENLYPDFEDVNSAPLDIELSEMQDVTSPDMDEVFRTAYGWDGLKSQSLKYDGKTIEFDAVFYEDAVRSQIKSAADYSVTVLLDGKYNNISPTEYENWRLGVSPEAVLINVYIEDELLLQQYFDGQTAQYYENTRLDVSCREAESESAENAAAEMKKLSGGSVNYIRAVSRDGIIFQVKTNRQIDSDVLEELKTAAQQLSDDYTRVIIELYSNDELYYDCFLYENQWQTGKWTVL